MHEASCVFSLGVVDRLHIRFRGSGKGNEKKLLAHDAFVAIMWCVWLDQISRVFSDGIFVFQLLLDKITYLASLLAEAAGAFKSYSIGEVQRNWDNM